MYVWAKLISHKYMRQFIVMSSEQRHHLARRCQKANIKHIINTLATTKLKFVKISLLHL